MGHKKEIKYPNIIIEMAKNGDTRKRVADILGISVMALYNKMIGRTEWTIGDIDKLCGHYKKNYYELFK